MKPERLDRSKESFSALKKRLQPSKVVDRYDLLLEDLFLIRNPRFKFIRDHSEEVKAFTEEYCAGSPLEDAGEWFFFPWNSTLAHCLPHEEHQEIRTARNRNIITKYDDRENQYLEINVEQKRGIDVAPETFVKKMEVAVEVAFKEKSSEFKELSSFLNDRPLFQLVFRASGDPEYFPAGIKQKWAKK